MKKKLGNPLPPIEDPAPPNDEEINRHVALWNATVPEYAGYLEAKPPGTAGARCWYDEVKRIMTIAKTGKVVTMAMKRKAMLLFQKRLKSK